MFCRSH